MGFDFSTAGEIWFGWGRVAGLGGRARALGRRAVVVTGSRADRAAPAMDALREAGVGAAIFLVAGEPTTEVVSRGAELAVGAGCDFVVGIGGGSAIDAAKAIAALMTNRGEVMEYLEVIGGARPLRERPAPCVAIPTTAGTGAEVTRNAVIESREHGVKVSLRHPWMLPALAIVDPALTAGLPREVTAYTGLDALTQLIEPFVSRAANPLTDGICREGILRVARSLRRACEDGADRGAREDMALASLFGGLALANARLGAVHGFAGPLGGMFHGVAHGAICAALLPAVMRANVRVLREKAGDGEALARFDALGQLLGGSPGDGADAAVSRVEGLCRELGVRGLVALGVDLGRKGEIVSKARAASSMKGNPIELTEGELGAILDAAA